MAMLEAFVHDPLINWRLLNTTTDAVDAANTPTADSSERFNCAFCGFIYYILYYYYINSLIYLFIVFP